MGAPFAMRDAMHEVTYRSGNGCGGPLDPTAFQVERREPGMAIVHGTRTTLVFLRSLALAGAFLADEGEQHSQCVDHFASRQARAGIVIDDQFGHDLMSSGTSRLRG